MHEIWLPLSHSQSDSMSLIFTVVKGLSSVESFIFCVPLRRELMMKLNLSCRLKPLDRDALASSFKIGIKMGLSGVTVFDVLNGFIRSGSRCCPGRDDCSIVRNRVPPIRSPPNQRRCRTRSRTSHRMDLFWTLPRGLLLLVVPL